MKSLFALILAASCVTCASSSIDSINIEDTNYPVDVKDSNYPIPSGAYFVSPDGKNTNSGKAPNSPWPVAKALTKAPRGSTIVFRGGTYRNIEAKLTKKLTLQAYPQEKAWIKGSVEVTGWVASGSIWRKDGWNYSFPQNVESIYIAPNYPMAGHRDMVYINGVSLKQVASKAEVVSGTFYVDAANKQLYIGDNPAGKTVEATAHKQTFAMIKAGSSNPSDTVVRGLGFAHYADQAIVVGAPKVTLENNTFVWNGVQGVNFLGQTGKTKGISSNAIVRGNTFSYNGRKGLGGGRAHHILLEGNTISYNNVENFSKTWDGAGVKFGKTDGAILRNNIVENNFATGIWFDESSKNATIVNNTSRYNRGIGIILELSHKAIIASNVVYNNTAGILVADSSSARVYNNTMSMNGKNLVIKDSPRKNTNAAEVAAGIAWITRNNVVKNNIFSSAVGKALFDASNCATNRRSALMIDAADYNAYYLRSSSKPQKVIQWSLGKGKCSVGYESIAAFKSATGLEENGLFVDNEPTDPFFVNAPNGDFRLKPDSPAIGHGTALPADIASAIGLPPGKSLNLGALYSQVSELPPKPNSN